MMGLFLFSNASRPVPGPTQPPIQWALGTLALGVKLLRRKANHSHPTSAEVKNVCSFASTSPIRLHGVVLI